MNLKLVKSLDLYLKIHRTGYTLKKKNLKRHEDVTLPKLLKASKN